MRHEAGETALSIVARPRQAKAYRTPQAKYLSLIILMVAMCLWLSVPSAPAQGTAFTYQGRLQDGGTAANGNYDLQFTLWDSLSGGAQIGSAQTLNTVAVSGGVFTVTLDFGASAFPGGNRFLEISVRPTGGGLFTVLTPRQPITATPYAVRSLNALSADTVVVAGVPSGSGNYIQNRTSIQPESNFNIEGNGTAGGTLSANIVNATTHYNINGFRVLSTPPGSNSIFAGRNAGVANAGASNAFFGENAGSQNLSGSWNSFFGQNAAFANTTGNNNAFFGQSAGFNNQMGFQNAFFGSGAGLYNTTGVRDTFIGASAGNGASGGNPNTSAQVNGSTAIGANATVWTSNTIALGTSAETTRIPGIFSVGSDTATTRGQINLLSPSGNANLYLQGAGVGYGINFGVSSSAPNATLYISQYDGTSYQDRLVINPNGTLNHRSWL